MYTYTVYNLYTCKLDGLILKSEMWSCVGATLRGFFSTVKSMSFCFPIFLRVPTGSILDVTWMYRKPERFIDVVVCLSVIKHSNGKSSFFSHLVDEFLICSLPKVPKKPHWITRGYELWKGFQMGMAQLSVSLYVYSVIYIYMYMYSFK